MQNLSAKEQQIFDICKKIMKKWEDFCQKRSKMRQKSAHECARIDGIR